MEKTASVKFIIKKGNDDFFTEFKFLNQKIKITKESHDFVVPFEKFKGAINSFPSIIELFNEQTLKQILINIYKCLNIFHLYLSKEGSTFELIFSDEYDFKDLRNKVLDYQFDDNGNKHRIRITLINYRQSIVKINNNFKFAPLFYTVKMMKRVIFMILFSYQFILRIKLYLVRMNYFILLLIFFLFMKNIIKL